MASIVSLATVGLLVAWPWLFSRRTAVIQLSIDEFDKGVLSPVPFGRDDIDAIGTAVTGRLGPRREGRTPVALDARTAAAIPRVLEARVADLRLGRRDALVAVVRGQMLVDTVDGSPRACLLASDVSLPAVTSANDVAHANVIPWSDLCARFADSPARTTLVVLDMGDLRWDPRLGVVAGLVPAQLDIETAEFGGGDRGSPSPGASGVWVLGSHDAHEFSGVSLVDRRGIFLRAVELALEGRADDRAWGGDGDGAVELDELVRFVGTWTRAWARRESRGSFDQRPVLWRVGRGRVPPDDVPKGIWLVTAGRPRTADPPSAGDEDASSPDTPATQAPLAASAPEVAPVAAAEVAGGGAADETSQPTGGSPDGSAATTGARQAGLWPALEALATDDPLTALPPPIDYAPHLWRETLALAARGSATPAGDSTGADPRARLVQKLEDDAAAFQRHQDNFSGGTPLGRLAKARQLAEQDFAPAWRDGDERVRAALVTRNRAVELASAVVDYIGVSAGSRISKRLTGSVGPLLDEITAVHGELRRLAASVSAAESTDGLDAGVRDLETAERQVREDVAGVGDELVRLIRDGGFPPPAAEIGWFRGSRLPTADQRRRLSDALAERTREEGVTAAGSSAGPRILELRSGIMPTGGPVPAHDEQASADLAARLHLAVRLLASLPDGPDSEARRGDLDPIPDDVRKVGSDQDPRAIVATAAAAGEALAGRLAAMPREIKEFARTPAGSLSAQSAAAMIDARLRLMDPRNAEGVDPGVVGWVPAVTAAVGLRLSIIADETDDAPLDMGRRRRVTVAMRSREPFPEQGELTLEFDRDRLTVCDADGRRLRSGQRFQVSSLSDRARFELRVEPIRPVPSGQVDHDTPLGITLSVGPRRDRSEKRFLLPRIERLAVYVRGRPGTVEGGDGEADGWHTLSIDPLLGDGDHPDEVAAIPSPCPEVMLRPFPGHDSAWEVEIANQSGEPRLVEVDLVSIGTAGRGDTAAERRRLVADDWRAFVKSLEARRSPPPTCRILTSSGPVTLPGSEGRVRVTMAEPRVAGAAQREPGDETPSIPIELGPTLALVIRDRQDPAGPTAESGLEGRPPPRGPGQSRTWVGRLQLRPRRPRSYLEAHGTWSAEDRTITIEVVPRGIAGAGPRANDSAFLPDGVVKIEAAPLGPAARELRFKQSTPQLSTGTPKATVTAVWNGPDEQAAPLALAVDGYPRAFVFRIDCRPVMAGVVQRPQGDWRQLEFVSPVEDQAFSPAPDSRIPFRFAIDVPGDQLVDDVVELLVREGRSGEGGGTDESRRVRTVDSDRQVVCVAAIAPPPNAFAVRATARDWEWELPVSDLGFRDVDVTLETRMRSLGGEGAAAIPAKQVHIVIDGTPPELTAPRRQSAERGKDVSIPITAEDGDPASAASGGRRPGASGVATIEWGIDDGVAGGEPTQWKRLRFSGQTTIVVPTKDLSVGRHTVVLRVLDGVGNRSRDETCELEVTAAKPAGTPGAE